MKEEVLVQETALGVAPSRLRRASWGAIFAGVFFTTVLQIMFTLLGMAVGFGPLRPAQRSNPAQAMAIGSGIWLLVTGLVSVWIGACVAGRLSGGPRRADGMLHGLIAWSVSVIVAFGLMATTIGAVVGGAAALVNGAVGSLGGTSFKGGDTVASLGQDVRAILPSAGALLSPTGRTEGPQVTGSLTAMAQRDSELAGALGKLETQGGASKSQADRDQVVNILTTKHNLSQQDAQALVNQWDHQFQQAKGQASQETHQLGREAANGLAQGAFWGFLALFLGLLVSAWGGWAGTASLPRPT
jgi:hypothetical protein